MPRTPAAVLLLAVTLSLGLVGCSGDDDPEEKSPTSEPTVAPDGIETEVEVGAVAGKLAKRPAQEAAAEVAAVVDDWIDAAYVGGEYPRSDFGDAYPGFTKGAAGLASKQSGLMSNQDVGEDVEAVTATRRVVRVDLLAPKGKVAAATAHVNLVMDLEGDPARTDQVRGRLLLTRKGGDWRIFGFDVERGEARG